MQHEDIDKSMSSLLPSDLTDAGSGMMIIPAAGIAG